MGIDIYKDRNGSEFIWSIDDSTFDELRTSFDILERRIGKAMDEYSDIAFPANTLKPLIDSVNEALKDDRNNKSLVKMREIILDAENKQHGLYFFGD